MQPAEELNATTFQTYVYMVKMGKPVGPRDLMRGANLSSPSVAYRNLQKLMDLGLVVKDEYGNYVVKEKGEMVTLNRVETNTLGESARKVRLALGISQQELANMTGISRECVYLFEHNLPVYLDARRKILKELWAIKAARTKN